jgi:hypothetical protein
VRELLLPQPALQMSAMQSFLEVPDGTGLAAGAVDQRAVIFLAPEIIGSG